MKGCGKILKSSASVKKEIVDQYKKHDNDTGSPEVQIALLNSRIVRQTEHLRHNQKDHHSRYGLFKLVGKQRSLMRYLYSKDVQRYRQIIDQLSLRDTIGRRGTAYSDK